MEFSRVTSKYQATVPADIRAALGVTAGDQLGWEVEDGEVRVRRIAPSGILEKVKYATVVDANVFAEWLSDDDDDLIA